MTVIQGSSVSALQAYGTRMGVSAHNVANVNTDEFKKSRALLTEGDNGGVKVSISRVNTRNSPVGGSRDGGMVMKEPSNTDLAEEFTQQIITQRGFEANTKTIKTQDEMLGSVIDIMG